jgi:hypothetical protein
VLNGKGEIEVNSVPKSGNREWFMPFTKHPAIKPGEEFNKLLVIARKDRFEIFVNDVMVCEPIAPVETPFPASVSLCVYNPVDVPVRAEFERIIIQSVQGLSSFEQRRDKMMPAK